MSRSVEKRILTLSPYPTWRAQVGGTKRTHYLNKGYARAGWEVLQVSSAGFRHCAHAFLHPEDLDHGHGYQEKVSLNPFIVAGNRILRWAKTAPTAPTLLPPLFCPGMRIADEMAGYRVVIFEHPYLFDVAAPHLRDDQLVVLDAHNIETHLFTDKLNARGLVGAAARAARAVEQRCMRRADLVFVCSPADGDAATREFGVDPTRINLAPNGVDLAEARLVTEEERKQAKLGLGLKGTTALFIGSHWPANIEAAFEVVGMAFARPEITYLIVGAVGNALSSNLPSNVVVAGMVDDLQPWFAAADVAVNPMVSGSGSNIKIFEYCAAGLPTVSTPFGARGIEDSEGRAVITCDLDQMPDRIADLLADNALPERRAAARALAEHKYDWTKIAAGMAEQIVEALEKKSVGCD